MNSFFVRTRLGCLIAMEIQRQKVPSGRYTAVFLYQKARTEDSELAYLRYAEFEKGSMRTVHVVSNEGFLKTFLSVFRVVVQTTSTGGTCFVASINSLPIALALRLVPFARLETFDDGAANILKSSIFYQGRPKRKPGLKSALLFTIFSKGWQYWMRQKTRKHHTIFPLHDNIVEERRLNFLDWDWEKLLVSEDIERLRGPISRIALGTCFVDFPEPGCVRRLAQNLADNSDLYIRHPREQLAVTGDNVHQFQSPAEAILIYLSRKRKIKVIHFNSTVAYALEGQENIDFENAVNPETFRLIVDESRATASFKQSIYE